MVIGVVFVTYFLPAIIAGLRRHQAQYQIFFLNLLLGWTLIGWVVAFLWSIGRAKPVAPTVIYVNQPMAAAEATDKAAVERSKEVDKWGHYMG
jgi:hypothetical protein